MLLLLFLNGCYISYSLLGAFLLRVFFFFVIRNGQEQKEIILEMGGDYLQSAELSHHFPIKT